MRENDLSRRDFHRLSMAALGGAVTGTFLAGCTTGGENGAGAGTGEGAGGTPASADFHLCRGLNTCEGKGATGENACAGQGQCATSSVHHSCRGQNDCKGRGGCGESVGQNECKGQGECAVPLSDDAWEKARARFEDRMDAQGKDYGEPPAKAS